VRSSAQTIERVLVWLRRTLAFVFGVPMAIGIAMSLVDSYRRRGKKPKPFPTTPPTTVSVGEGTITTYTFGQDLYADMLAAIEGAQRQVLFETYIWKGDAVGEQFKAALAAAADRGVEVYCIYDGFANLVVSPRFKRFPPNLKVLKYPAYSAGWRFFDLRRYGRDHRKILVVDDKEAYVGGYNIGSAYETEWRDTHVRITGPVCRTCGGRSPTSGTSTGGAGSAPASGRSWSRRPASGSRTSGCSATCHGCGCSPSAACISRRSTAPAPTSG
jgi:cardiolipin synthase A/B